MKGWVKLHRQLMENPLWFSEPFTRGQAWVDMLMLANHKDNFFYVRGNKIDVKRGQIGVSEEQLSNRWQWSRGKVRRFLNELEKSHQIVQQKSKIKSLITLVNYEKYQRDDTTDSTTDSTTDGHQTVQQTDTNKNDNNDKNVKKQQADRKKFDPYSKPVKEEIDLDAEHIQKVASEKMEDFIITNSPEILNYRVFKELLQDGFKAHQIGEKIEELIERFERSPPRSKLRSWGYVEKAIRGY